MFLCGIFMMGFVCVCDKVDDGNILSTRAKRKNDIKHNLPACICACVCVACLFPPEVKAIKKHLSGKGLKVRSVSLPTASAAPACLTVLQRRDGDDRCSLQTCK